MHVLFLLQHFALQIKELVNKTRSVWICGKVLAQIDEITIYLYPLYCYQLVACLLQPGETREPGESQWSYAGFSTSKESVQNNSH